MILRNTIQLLPDDTNCCKTSISTLSGRNHLSVLRYGPDDDANFCINWKKMMLCNKQNLKTSVTMYPKVPYNLTCHKKKMLFTY